MQLEEVAVVDQLSDHQADVVGLVRLHRHDLGEARPDVGGRGSGRLGGRGVEIVPGQHRHQVAHVLEGALLVIVHHGRDTRVMSVHVGAAEVVVAHPFAAPPAHGPSTTATWGTTPDASTLRRKMPP